MDKISSPLPELPAVYEPVALDGSTIVLETALDMARQGRGEGTLVWATQQPKAAMRPGKTWYSPAQGLYLSLILEPEFAPEATGQMALIGLLSMGVAIAEAVVPMTDLRYRWPNDLLLSGSKVCGVGLRQDLTEGWLVLGVSVNVGEEPAEVIDGGCVQIEGGNAELAPSELLQGFARQFLHWINRWDEEGLEPILSAMRGRWGSPGESVLVELEGNRILAGAFQDVGAEGQLVLETDTEVQTVSLNDFFALERK